MELVPVTEKVIEYAHKMGIKSELPPTNRCDRDRGSAAAGDHGGIRVFPNEGVLWTISILKIETRTETSFEENQASKREVLSKEDSILMIVLRERQRRTGGQVRRYYACLRGRQDDQEYAMRGLRIPPQLRRGYGRV